MIADVHHVGIAVRDLDAALRFYSEALGLPVARRGRIAARGAEAALLSVGGSYLELVRPTEETSPIAAHVRDRGEGLHHVGLRTDDVDALVASLRDRNVPLADPQPRQGITGRLSYLSPEAMDGALLEVVQPLPELRGGGDARDVAVKRVDHVVFRLPNVEGACRRMRDYFGIETKRTFQRGDLRFAFLRPGDVIMELIGPREPPQQPRPGAIAGLAFECVGIDDLAASLKANGYPAGEPHPALQGGRIVSVHPSGPGLAGVPVAFIDFTGSQR